MLILSDHREPKDLSATRYRGLQLSFTHLSLVFATLTKTTGVYLNSSQIGNVPFASRLTSQPSSSLCYNLQFISTQENS